MPHWNSAGEEEWVCQLGAHVCTGASLWVDVGSPLAAKFGCYGNVCTACVQKYSRLHSLEGIQAVIAELPEHQQTAVLNKLKELLNAPKPRSQA